MYPYRKVRQKKHAGRGNPAYIACARAKKLVPRKGLEPPRLAAPEPKSGASTNFATWAHVVANA
jgi:hypothetical protein